MGWWEAAAVGAAGLLGASQGGGESTATETSAPWAEAQPYMTDVMGQAKGLYNQTAGMGPFSGGIYAGMNPMQQKALQDQAAFSQQGAQGAQNMFGMADRFAGAGAGAGGMYEQAGALAGAGPGAAYEALQPFGAGMKAAAGRDIARGLYEEEIPGINLGAAAAGGARGSRAGAMEAVARRGAGDRLADISAQVDMGLMGQAQDVWGRQMQGMGAAGAGLGGLAGQAAGMYGSGYGLGQQAIGSRFGAGATLQADQQAQLDAERQRHQDFQLGSWAPLQQYAGIAQGMGGLGGTTTASTPNPSALQSGLQAGTAMYGMLQ